MQGVKDDGDKARVDLVPVSGIVAAARAFGYGADKYTPWNWTKGLAWGRLYGATLRHLFAWADGYAFDEESGLSHLDHAMASLMMLQAHEENGLGVDDRRGGMRGPLPTEAFISYEPSPETWRIALKSGSSLIESDYFADERWASYEEARHQLDRAAAMEAVHYDVYAIQRVD